jgi:hypothetical protein
MKLTIVFLLSLTLTCLVAAAFGAAGSQIIGTFWGWFWVSLLAQFIGFIAWNTYSTQKLQAEYERMDAEVLKGASTFVINLACGYCNVRQNVPIQLNRKNEFLCESCNQTNGVHMLFQATTKTTPIDSVKIPLPNSTFAEFKVTK